MKITIDRKTLVNALTTVKNAASHKAALPVLANVAICAFEKSVEFICTDMNINIRVKAEAVVSGKTDKDKGTTVRVGLLHDLVRSFPGDSVELEVFKSCVKVRCGEARYNLGTLDIDEFPATPRVTSVSDFKLPQATLRRLLEATAFCSRTADEGRYVLCGSYLGINGSITAAATDGRRLAVLSAETTEKLTKASVVIPRQTVDELLRLLSDDEDKKVAVVIGEKNIQFVFNDTTIVSKVIEGNYPDYTKVIPKDLDEPVTVGRVDLLSMLQRVNLVAEKCFIELRGQTLTVRSYAVDKDRNFGDAQEALLVPKIKKEVTTRFNIQYLIEALQAVTDDEVQYYGKETTGVFKVASQPWVAVTAAMTEKKDKDAAKPAAKETDKQPELAAKK